MQEAVDALARRFGAASVEKVRCVPDETIETLFGRQPALHSPEATAMGFQHDGTAVRLITRSLGLAQILLRIRYLNLGMKSANHANYDFGCGVAKQAGTVDIAPAGDNEGIDRGADAAGYEPLGRGRLPPLLLLGGPQLHEAIA